MSNDQNEPAKKGPFIEEEASMSDLRRASEELKAKIAEAKARNDMPIDFDARESKLGQERRRRASRRSRRR